METPIDFILRFKKSEMLHKNINLNKQINTFYIFLRSKYIKYYIENYNDIYK